MGTEPQQSWFGWKGLTGFGQRGWPKAQLQGQGTGSVSCSLLPRGEVGTAQGMRVQQELRTQQGPAAPACSHPWVLTKQEQGQGFVLLQLIIKGERPGMQKGIKTTRVEFEGC